MAFWTKILKEEMMDLKLKKILPAVFLAALLIWGGYDLVHKNTINNNQLQSDKAAEVNTGIEKGNLAPDFQLKTLDGKDAKLSDYRGKKVILNFWATWCPPCKAEVPDVEKFYSENKDKGVVVLGVDLTKSEKGEFSIIGFATSYKITYPILLDAEDKVNSMYQVTGIPTSYIIDTKGIIRDKVVGPMDYERMDSMISAIK